VFQGPKGVRWAFGIAALEAEEVKQLSILPGLLEDPSVLGLLRVEEQQVPITTRTGHQQQCRTNRDSLIPTHKLICQLESQEVFSKTHSPFISPIWPVRKSIGEWNHRMLGVGRDLCGSSIPTSLPKQGHLQQAAQDLVHACREYLQRRRLHIFPGQHVPVLLHHQSDSRLPWPKCSPTTTECCCARQAKNINIVCSQRQPSDMPPLTSLMHSSPSLWQQSAGHNLLSLGEVSSTPGI